MTFVSSTAVTPATAPPSAKPSKLPQTLATSELSPPKRRAAPSPGPPGLGPTPLSWLTSVQRKKSSKRKRKKRKKTTKRRRNSQLE